MISFRNHLEMIERVVERVASLTSDGLQAGK